MELIWAILMVVLSFIMILTSVLTATICSVLVKDCGKVVWYIRDKIMKYKRVLKNKTAGLGCRDL